MPVVVRRLEHADAAALVDIRKEMLVDAPWAFASSPEDDRGSILEHVQDALQAPSDSVRMGGFDGNGRLIATTGLVREPKLKRRHIALIVGVYVRPEARGSGAGRAIMLATIAEARSWGVGIVQLAVSERAASAQRLYRSLGFVVWGTEQRALKIGDDYVREWHMALDLD